MLIASTNDSKPAHKKTSKKADFLSICKIFLFNKNINLLTSSASVYLFTFFFHSSFFFLSSFFPSPVAIFSWTAGFSMAQALNHLPLTDEVWVRA
jgi:hypothetical protein